MKGLGREIRKYLKNAGFNVQSERPQYLVRNIMDIVVAFIYSMISIGCVINDEASILVLFLNILCMCRTILRNTIKSSEMTDTIRKIMESEDLEQKAIGKYHYYHKGLVQITLGVTILLIMIPMNFNVMEEIIVKLLTYVIIGMIFLDDLENTCVSIFGAYIEPANNRI